MNSFPKPFRELAKPGGVEVLYSANHLHLYLFTLEVDPLVVGKVYNPLPSHLTLVSRFWSALPLDKVIDAARPALVQSAPIELVFGGEAVIGPKETAVHLIQNNGELKNLHSQLAGALTQLGVSFTLPQFIGKGHRPHVSKRPSVQFPAGHTQTAQNAYLIEVEIAGKEHLRNIRAKFKLGS